MQECCLLVLLTNPVKYRVPVTHGYIFFVSEFQVEQVVTIRDSAGVADTELGLIARLCAHTIPRKKGEEENNNTSTAKSVVENKKYDASILFYA